MEKVCDAARSSAISLLRSALRYRSCTSAVRCTTARRSNASAKRSANAPTSCASISPGGRCRSAWSAGTNADHGAKLKSRTEEIIDRGEADIVDLYEKMLPGRIFAFFFGVEADSEEMHTIMEAAERMLA